MIEDVRRAKCMRRRVGRDMFVKAAQLLREAA